MVSIQFGGYTPRRKSPSGTRGRAPLFPIAMMLTIVYISMAHESH